VANPNTTRGSVLFLLIVSIGLLIPGLFAPVLTIRGVITRQGLAQMAPTMLERGLDDNTVKTLKAMMNPQMVTMIETFGGDIRKSLIEKITPQLTAALAKGEEIEVYQQTRSIVSSVQRLYEVGSPVPATLILLFSVIVPLGKGLLVAWAMFLRSGAWRSRVLHFVELIAKWSMADVFVVALFIAFLAAQASQTPPGDPSATPLVAFTAYFGPGFYWFAAYCLFSLATQQYTARIAAPRMERALTQPAV
jgi:Paraquat-inducible protein A